MIAKREILAAASATGLLPGVVEKDYVLGWLLAGIHAHPDLRGAWVFKGGTCLKKCYFDDYRFSEDLEFTTARKSRGINLISPHYFAEDGYLLDSGDPKR